VVDFEGSSAPDDETVVAHEAMLRRRYPERASRYREMMFSAPDSARAEAVVFAWLESTGLRPTISEDPGAGGPDFRCAVSSCGDFSLEVTALAHEAM
jgi:hypothetical protein